MEANVVEHNLSLAQKIYSRVTVSITATVYILVHRNKHLSSIEVFKKCCK